LADPLDRDRGVGHAPPEPGRDHVTRPRAVVGEPQRPGPDREDLPADDGALARGGGRLARASGYVRIASADDGIRAAWARGLAGCTHERSARCAHEPFVIDSRDEDLE